MTITKTQRWLDLITFLVRRHFPVPVDDIMNGVPAYREKWNSEDPADHAAVRRMFERDKDELRQAGIPLETVEYSIEQGAETELGYRLAARDFYLPYLRLVGASPPPRPAVAATTLEITGEEALTAIEALRRVAALPDSPLAIEARSALRKLAFDLDLDAFAPAPVIYAAEAAESASHPDVDALRAPAPLELRTDLAADFVADLGLGAGDEPREPRPDAGGVRERLRLLTNALRRRKRVRFDYHGLQRGEPSDRDVAPYGLVYQHGHWYLVGHDATRAAIRVFRVARMRRLDVAPGARPDYALPADFRIADHAAREPWELGDDEPVTADVRFRFPLALWAERNGKGERVQSLAGGAQLRRFHVRQPDPFLRWLQQFGGDAVIDAPPELRRAQLTLVRETLAVYGRPPEAEPRG